ncbi:MAG: helix-turn-helix domain-containing protein [Deltaproteobacteria bacterium]|nr:helix-turn-helix domain-containing protein [Deltaproteobacteria bacterium]
MDRFRALCHTPEILDVSPDTVNELARKHALPGMKRGRQWRFRRRDVAFLKRQMREQVAA